MGSIRTHRRREIEAEYGSPLRLILLHLYYRRGMDQASIARLLRVPEGTVASWFLREHIQPATLAAERAVEMLDAEEART
jgi:hypothetical protein